MQTATSVPVTTDDHLSNALSITLQDIQEMLDDSETSLYNIKIPDPNSIDQPVEVLAALVAKTSNAYGRICRISGIAHAKNKLAKGSYDRAFKSARVGKNPQEREANAMISSSEQHEVMVRWEAISSLAARLEGAARVASESARKLYDKAIEMQVAQQREERVGYAN